MFMPRKGAATPEAPNPVLTGEELLSALDQARQTGYIVLQCGSDFMSHQHAAINSGLNNDLKFWWEGLATPDNQRPEDDGPGTSTMLAHGAMMLSGLAYDGAYRRSGRLRLFGHLDLAPEELMPGDKVGLRELSTGAQKRSLIIETVDHPLAARL